MTISLEKKKEDFVSLLKENEVSDKLPPIRVHSVLDVSGSIQSLYANGTMQDIFTSTMAIGLSLDDDGNVDNITFDDEVYRTEQANIKNYENFVKNNIINGTFNKWNGTLYSKAFNEVLSFYFPQYKNYKTTTIKRIEKENPSIFNLFGLLANEKEIEDTIIKYSDKSRQSTQPSLCLFYSDGDNMESKEKSIEIIKQSLNYNIYWVLIGISFGSNDTFVFMQELADTFSNCSFVNMSTVDHNTLYKEIVSPKFCVWLKVLENNRTIHNCCSVAHN